MRRLAQARRHWLRVDLDEIAEHVVVAHLQRLDAGRVGVARLQPAITCRLPSRSLRCSSRSALEAVADEAAVALVDAAGSSASAASRLCSTRPGADFRRSSDAHPALAAGRGAAGAGECAASAASGRRWRRAPRRDRADRRGPTRAAPARGPDPAPRFSSSRSVWRSRGSLGEIGDGVEPGIDGGGIGQRAAEPARQARARRPPVTVRSMAASRLPARAPWLRAHQLEIGARRGVDEEKAAGAFLARRAQQRRAADLGHLDIGEEAGERGKLGPW